MARSLVIGVREETMDGVRREVRDVIGIIEGDGYQRQFLALATARCGSIQEFHAVYPRIVLAPVA